MVSQEVNFWFFMEFVLEGIESQLWSDGVILIFEIFKYVKCFQVMVSFMVDIGLKEVMEKV